MCEISHESPFIMQENQVRNPVPLLEVPNSAGKLYTEVLRLLGLS